MKITHKIEMDLRNNHTIFSQIHAVQSDSNTRAVEINLFEGGVPWPVPDGVTIGLSYRKPDGTKGLYDSLPDGTKAVTVKNNTVTVVLAPQVLTAAGDVKAAILMNDDALNQLASFPFTIEVEANPGAGAVVSNNYYYYTNLDSINRAIGDLANLETTDKSSLVAAINEAARTGGSGGGGQPTPVKLASEMTDKDCIYLYMGEEEGYVYGSWYYWDDAKWTVGSAYGIGRTGEKGDAFTYEDFTEEQLAGLVGPQGEQGPVGPQGPKGEQGEAGPQGEPGADGTDGYTPVRGTDYWTEADIAEIKAYVEETILGGAW